MKKIYISQIDTFFVNGSYPIEFLFYYKNGLDTGKIRKALQKLSSSFWPMFGEYDAGMILFENYSENDCFNEEVIDQEFDPLQPEETIYATYSCSIPETLNNLFFLKVIQYRNGTVIIPKLDHLAGDGYSYFYFLALLAATTQTSYIPFKKGIIRRLYKPHHRRTVFKNFRFDETVLAPVEENRNLTIVFEDVSRESVRKTIKDISGKLDQQVSANDILSAMIIKKLIDLQKRYSGEDIQLTMPVDVRRQIKEYGPKFFGNGLLFTTIGFKVNDVEQSDISKIAIEIRKHMPAVSKESYMAYLDTIEAYIGRKESDKLRPYNPESGCLVTNLSKMPVNRLNFGAGNPDFLFPLTIARNAAAILADKDKYILRMVY
jgi:hypothetical protein